MISEWGIFPSMVNVSGTECLPLWRICILDSGNQSKTSSSPTEFEIIYFLLLVGLVCFQT